MKQQLLLFVILFMGATHVSCSDKNENTPPGKGELLSFTLQVDNVGYQGVIHPDAQKVTIGGIEYASFITGVSYKLSPGTTITPLPESLIGAWKEEVAFTLSSDAGPSVIYKVKLNDFKADKPAGIEPGEPDGKVIFEEHFNRDGEPDEASWSLCPRGSSTWSRYMSGSYDQAFVKDGKLVLQAERADNTYKTGGVQTVGKVEFLYGKVEVCARFTKTAQGGFPAIWMMPANADGLGWPACGEIDIMEQLNHDKFVHHTIHSRYKNDLGNNTPNPTATSPYNVNAFNVYGVEWTSEYLNFTVNGQVALTYPNLHLPDEATVKQWPFNRPFYLILNFAVGGPGTWPGDITDSQLPAYMEVDWVRVVQK